MKEMGLKKAIMVTAVAIVLGLSMLVGCSSNTAASSSAAASDTNSAAASSEVASSSANEASDDSNAAEADTIAVNLAINGGEGETMVQYVGEVDVAADATVLDALEASPMAVVVDDGPYGAFVQSIDGLANEGSSGWTYTVNGEEVQVSAGAQQVAEGDLIEWNYVTY